MFDMRPYRNNNDRRNNLSAYNPFREMDAFERNFFNDPFGSWFDHSALASFNGQPGGAGYLPCKSRTAGLPTGSGARSARCVFIFAVLL